MIKSMNVKRDLSKDKLTQLVDRIDSIEKATVGELWVLGNDVISERERCNLLSIVYYKKSLCYKALVSSKREVPKFTGIHKLHIDGVRELKVG